MRNRKRIESALWAAAAYAVAVALSVCAWLFALGAWDIANAWRVIGAFALVGGVVGAVIGWRDYVDPWFE